MHIKKQTAILSIHKIFADLDKPPAILFSGVCLTLTLWLLLTSGRPVYIIATAIGFLASIFYLAMRKHLLKSVLLFLSSPKGIKQSQYLILNILFFVLFSYSILSIYLRPEPYVRPLGYFIAIALMASVLAVQILFLPRQKVSVFLALLQIMVLALSLRWSQQLIFPGSILGDDTWLYRIFTTDLLSTGHIPQGWAYSKLPNMFLTIGTTSLITSLNYKMATMLSVGLLQVICDLGFIFLLGKIILNTKTGLLAALLLAVATHHINLGWAVIATTAAAIMIPIIVYLLFRSSGDKRPATIALVLLLSGSLILTHTVTTLCMAVLVLTLWVGSEIYNRAFKEKSVPVATVLFATLFSVGMLSWWMYASGHIRNVASAINWGLTLDWVPRVGEVVSPEFAQNVEVIPFSGELVQHIGMLLFFALSFLGCLCLWSPKIKNRDRFVLPISGAIPLVMGFLPWTYQMGMLHRWWYFSQILLAIPLAIFLLSLCGMFKSKLTNTLLLATVMAILTFLMIMSPMANTDNRIFSGQMSIRYAFTESEAQSMDTISTTWPGIVATDKSFQRYTTPSQTRVGIRSQILTGDYTSLNDTFVVIRKEAVSYPRWCGVYRLKYNPYQALEEQGFSCVYNCGSVKGFVSREGEILAK